MCLFGQAFVGWGYPPLWGVMGHNTTNSIHS